MFTGVLGLALFAGGVGTLFALRGTPAGPHRLLTSSIIEEIVTLGIVLLVVCGAMLMVYGFVSRLV